MFNADTNQLQLFRDYAIINTQRSIISRMIYEIYKIRSHVVLCDMKRICQIKMYNYIECAYL